MVDDIKTFVSASREICDKTPPGPWTLSTCSTGEKCWCRVISCPPYGQYNEDTIAAAGGVTTDVAVFMSHARQALPTALDIIEAQQEQIDAADRSLASMLRDIGKYHDRIVEQQAEIERIRSCRHPSATPKIVYKEIDVYERTTRICNWCKVELP